MKTLVWLAGGALFVAAALSVFWAFRSPDFVAGLAAIGAAAIWKAVSPALAPDFSPQHAAKVRQATRRNEPMPGRTGLRHPGEQR